MTLAGLSRQSLAKNGSRGGHAGLVGPRVDGQFDRMAEMFALAGVKIRPALTRAINWTGAKARTAVQRSLAKQTGLKYGRVRQVTKAYRATAAMLVSRLVARDGYTSLKEFGALQGAQGVSAAPWRKRRVFPHTFIVGSLGGHVFERTSSARLPIPKLWGPAIPAEMVRDETKKKFEALVAIELPLRVEHETEAILAKHAPEG